MKDKNKNKDKKENPNIKKIKIVVVILLLLFLIIYRIIALFTTHETSNVNYITSVKEEYEFVMVSDSIGKYMDAINSKNEDEIISIYSSDYKDENKITTENVLNVNNLSNIKSYKINQLYKDATYYYVWVTFYTENDEPKVIKNDVGLTLQYYANNTFSIIPKIPENLIQGD